MAELRVNLTMRLPWWWRGYLVALQVFHKLGGKVDVDRAAELVARHTRFEARAPIIRETFRLGARQAAELPDYAGTLWHTDCTCAVRKPAKATYQGRLISVCRSCGSTRVGTGT